MFRLNIYFFPILKQTLQRETVIKNKMFYYIFHSSPSCNFIHKKGQSGIKVKKDIKKVN